MPLGATRFGFQAGDTEFDAEYLVVAGGGSGAYRNSTASASAGGGAGGYRSSVSGESTGGGGTLETPLILEGGITYTVTVGGGGSNYRNDVGSNGANSSLSGLGITTITSNGGGAGNRSSGGGSGGGRNTGTSNGYPGTANQGYRGGQGFSGNYYSGGGGGGASQTGRDNNTNQTVPIAGNGIASSITGSSVPRADGGNPGRGNGYYPKGSHTPGGLGTGGYQDGGGNGINASPSNRGSGGGGSTRQVSPYNSNAQAGNGSSGVVIIRVADTVPTATTTGSPTIHTPTGFKVYEFTGSGTITF